MVPCNMSECQMESNECLPVMKFSPDSDKVVVSVNV